jgi:hypothetical protein
MRRGGVGLSVKHEWRQFYQRQYSRGRVDVENALAQQLKCVAWLVCPPPLAPSTDVVATLKLLVIGDSGVGKSRCVSSNQALHVPRWIIRIKPDEIIPLSETAAISVSSI